MQYHASGSIHSWSSSSLKLALIGALIGSLTLVAMIWSVEVIRLECDRSADRCDLVNLSLVEGRVARSFAISEVARYDRGFSITSRRSRSQRYTTKYERPVVDLVTGESLQLRLRGDQYTIETSTFVRVGEFFKDPSRQKISETDFFSGVLLPFGAIGLVLVVLVGLLATRRVRLELDLDSGEYRFARIGAFSPAWSTGSLDELSALVIQPDPSTPSPGVFLRTRDDAWLAVSFDTSCAQSRELQALRQILEQRGIAMEQAVKGQGAPRINYLGALIALIVAPTVVICLMAVCLAVIAAML